MSSGVLMAGIRGVVQGAMWPTVSLCWLPVWAIAAGPPPQASAEIKQRVDLIELNHFYDCHGQHQFDQVIFYEWSPDYLRFHVIAWSLVEGDLKRLPRRMPGSGQYQVVWFDRDAKLHREVRAGLYRETWTQSDPERTNKQWIEEKDRLCLVKIADQQRR